MLNKRVASYKQYLALFILVLSCGGHAAAQGGIDTGLANRLQASVDSLRAAYNVKGISAAAFIPGKGTWKGVTGVSYGTLPIDTTMLFSMGSITKTFVAAEIFKLIDAGSLALTDTVGSILPPMPNVNGAITVKQLLGHRSGMADYLNPSWQAAMSADPYAMWYYPTALAAFSQPAVGAPGSPYMYCNANYALLGMIIEAKTSDSLHRVLRSDFLNPLGLSNTHMEMFEPYPNTIAHNWAGPISDPSLAVDESGTPHMALWTSVEAAGGYFSDAADLVKWGYNLYSGNVISPASLSEMLTFTGVSSSYFNGYGLGAQRFVANGRTYVGHAGNYYGYAASMIYYPQDSICVAVLINTDCIATFEARALMNALINKIATGVHEQTWRERVVLSPNPAGNELNILVPGNNNVEATITDISGKEVYRGTLTAGNSSVNTAGYKAGIYFVRLSNYGAVWQGSVVVQH